MLRRTAMFFLCLATLVAIFGVFAFAGPATAVAKIVFFIFIGLFLALAAVSFVLPLGPSESR